MSIIPLGDKQREYGRSEMRFFGELATGEGFFANSGIFVELIMSICP